MTCYIIKHIIHRFEYFTKRILLLILHIFLYFIIEILKIISIMAAVYAIGQLLYIAWERYVEKYVMSELKALGRISMLSPPPNIQSVHFEELPSTEQTNVQTADELELLTKETEESEQINSSSDAVDIQKRYKKEEDSDSSKSLGSKTSRRITIVEEPEFQKKSPLEQKVINQNVRKLSQFRKSTSSSEKESGETFDQGPSFSQRRRRRRKQSTMKYNPVRTLYENTSSESQVNDLPTKHRFPPKRKYNVADSAEDGEMLNIPVRVSNYLKKPETSQGYTAGETSSRTLRRSTSARSSEGFVQRDERQINKAVYARRSTMH